MNLFNVFRKYIDHNSKVFSCIVVIICFMIIWCITYVNDGRNSYDNNIISSEDSVFSFILNDSSVPGGRIEGELENNVLKLTDTRYKSIDESGGVESVSGYTLELTDPESKCLMRALSKMSGSVDIEQCLYYDLIQSVANNRLSLNMYSEKTGDTAIFDVTDTIDEKKRIEKDTINRLMLSEAYIETDIDGRKQMMLYTLKDLYDRGIISDYFENQRNLSEISYIDIYGYKFNVKLNKE